MTTEIILPCLVLNESGQIGVNLKHGKHATSSYSNWQCTDYECPFRGRRFDAHKNLRVKIGTDSSGRSGVVWCEEVGRVIN